MGWTRDELIFLLREAAVIEHSLMCQYLYGALSLKRDAAEGLTLEQLDIVNSWEQTILMVARQEMEHLSLVCNLLTAIGGAPQLSHPNFPQPAGYYPFEQALTRFSLDTIKRFVWFERPSNVPPSRLPRFRGLRVDEDGLFLAPPDPWPVAYQTIEQLYQAIRAGFVEIPMTDQELFTGPPKAQVGGMALQYLYPKSIQFTPGVFDVYMFPVTDRASALKAIQLIIEQGEGAPKDEEFCHYRRFVEIQSQYEATLAEDPRFDPARPLVSNPALYAHPDANGATLLTNPHARTVQELYNGTYETLLLLLVRFFAFTDETAEEIDGLLYTFYPLMTMVIRPLGELLTQMPAFDPPTGEMAGPSFEVFQDISLLPHKRSAWRYLNERLDGLAQDCALAAAHPAMPERLKFISESLQYIATRFGALVKVSS